MESAMAEKEEVSCCNPVDPLAKYAALSLLRGECDISFDYSKHNEPVIKLDCINDRFKPEALISPKKLVEQVMTIVENEEAGVPAIEQPRKKRPDLPTNIDNEVDKFLDELLSDICKDFNEDEAINLLHERSQVKPPEKLSFPQREGIKDVNLKSSIGNFEKPQNSLLDIHNLMKGRTPQKKKQRNDDMPQNAFCKMFSLLASPPLSKSPFAPWISLKKSLLQPNSLNYQFLAHDMDELPTRNLSPFEGTNEQCSPSRKHSNVSHGQGQLSISHVEGAIGSNQNGSNEKKAIGEKSRGSNEKTDDTHKEIQKCGVTLKKGGRQPRVNKDTKRLRRQSLEADATARESGLRRSTRIRVQPLKF